MAPICADPRQIVISLDQQRRLELLRLVDDVLLYMTSQQQAKVDELGNLSAESSDGEDEHTKEIEEKTEALHVGSGPDDGSQSHSPAHSPKETTTAQTAGFSGANLLKSVKSVKIPNPWKKTTNAPTKATRKAEEIQLGALKYMVEWQQEFMPKFEEIARVQDNEQIEAERKARLEALNAEKNKTSEPETQTEKPTIQPEDKTADDAGDLAALQQFYLPMPTSLTKLQSRDRKECISCILLLLLSTGKYSGHSRAMILYLASSLNLPESFVDKEECEITQSLIESSTADQSQKENMSAEAEAAKRQHENKFSRMWKVGLASVAGATIIGVTGGLAAPLVAGALGSILGGVGLGGVASFLGIFWMNGALVGALFGAYGAKMTGSMMDKYAKEVEDFRFIPLEQGKTQEGNEKSTPDNKSRRLRVTIGVNGWLNNEEDITKPWHTLSADSEVFALRYEMKTLLTLGTALRDLVQSFAWKALKVEIIKRTVLATLFAALWPIQVLSLASNVDNPFSHASNRSKKAGRLLADALINKVQGERPVTLIGYSLGAVAIHSCLQSLAERQAFGLVDTVVIIGAPAPSDPAHWRTLRTVVSGKIFNVYSENDMVLGFVYRMHSLAMGVAGLQAIEGVAEVHNLNLSDKVSGHLRYPEIIGEILRKCGFVGIEAGGEIETDEVIKMKQDYANGKQIEDLPLDAEEKQKLSASESDGEGHQIKMVADGHEQQDISLVDKKNNHEATNSTAFI